MDLGELLMTYPSHQCFADADTVFYYLIADS